MDNQRGEILTAILIILIVGGLLFGGWMMTDVVPCDPKVQKCIESGSVDAPPGATKN